VVPRFKAGDFPAVAPEPRRGRHHRQEFHVTRRASSPGGCARMHRAGGLLPLIILIVIVIF
jgi:hypothetical protein